MAENTKNTKASDTLPAEEKKDGRTAGSAPVKKKLKPPQYTADELTAASEKVFGIPQECAGAAFKIAGKTAMSLDEAKGIVEKFMKQEVK